jgi:cell division protein FtsI (penicillin-binding protein 3)
MRISIGARTTPQSHGDFAGRRKLLLSTMLLAMLILVGRAVYLQILNKDFLQDKGDLQHVGVVAVSAYRGQIQDRNAEPLAISTPVQSIWINPRQLKAEEDTKIGEMAKILALPEKELRAVLKKEAGKRFFYLKRQINPSLAEKVKALEITGVYFERAFKRYYPAGATTGHLLGFTDIDDVGQEGMEHGYEQILRGKIGKKQVIKDGKGQIIKDVENIEEAEAGRDLVLTIDERLQYLAYRELQNAMIVNKAHSASLVVLDAKNGDVLATVSQPAFNPNNRKELSSNRYRNRAIMDSFEPGSTVKPFVIAAALDGALC